MEILNYIPYISAPYSLSGVFIDEIEIPDEQTDLLIACTNSLKTHQQTQIIVHAT